MPHKIKRRFPDLVSTTMYKNYGSNTNRIPPDKTNLLQWIDGGAFDAGDGAGILRLPNHPSLDPNNYALERSDEVIHEFTDGYSLNLTTDVALWYG